MKSIEKNSYILYNNKIKDSINFGLLIERDSDLDISPDEFTEKVLYFLKNKITPGICEFSSLDLLPFGNTTLILRKLSC